MSSVEQNHHLINSPAVLCLTRVIDSYFIQGGLECQKTNWGTDAYRSQAKGRDRSNFDAFIQEGMLGHFRQKTWLWEGIALNLTVGRGGESTYGLELISQEYDPEQHPFSPLGYLSFYGYNLNSLSNLHWISGYQDNSMEDSLVVACHFLGYLNNSLDGAIRHSIQEYQRTRAPLQFDDYFDQFFGRCGYLKMDSKQFHQKYQVEDNYQSLDKILSLNW